MEVEIKIAILTFDAGDQNNSRLIKRTFKFLNQNIVHNILFLNIDLNVFLGTSDHEPLLKYSNLFSGTQKQAESIKVVNFNNFVF